MNEQLGFPPHAWLYRPWTVLLAIYVVVMIDDDTVITLMENYLFKLCKKMKKQQSVCCKMSHTAANVFIVYWV